jgi:hypothetical protein
MAISFLQIPRWKILLVAGATAGIVLFHLVVPLRGDASDWLHPLFLKVYYVPVLIAAACLGVRGTLLTAFAVSVVLALHLVWVPEGTPIWKADHIGEIGSIWVIAVTASLLFHRERCALEQTRQAQEDTLTALASSLDLRERETGLHSRRVRDYTLMLARAMGVRGESALLNMGLGALLHDMGKIGVSDTVLFKPAGLADEEVQAVRRHPELGASLIGSIRFLEGAREIVRHHHERFDGSGYPDGLSGKAIPLGARIFAVVDVFDALTTDRPYRAALSFQEAAALIAGERGRHFDPAVVDAFLSIPFRDWAEAATRNGVILREG